MSEQTRHDAGGRAQSDDGLGALAPWQEAILSRALVGIGALLIALPLGYLVASGDLRHGLSPDIPVHIAGGVLLLVLRGSERTSARLKAGTLLLVGAFCLFMATFQGGWGAGAVVGFGLWITLGPLLFGRRAVYVGLLGIFSTTVVYALFVRAGLLHFATDAFSPRHRASWYLFGAVFLAGMGIVVLTLREGMRLIAGTHARIAQLVAKRNREIDNLDTLRDATKQAENRLATAHKAQTLTHLSAGLNHQLNNALMAMRGALDAIRSPTPDTNLSNEVSAITAAARDSAKVMQSLMIFSRRHETPTAVVDIGDSLHAFRETMRHGVPEDIEFALSATPGLDVEINEHQLRQAVLNLVQNAADATPSGGRIEVRAERRHLDGEDARAMDLNEGDFVVISVIDTGHGMSEEVRTRAIDPFFSTHTLATHAGMGLTVAYGIVRQAGGYLHLQPGRSGTSVHLVIPGYAHGPVPSVAADLFAAIEAQPETSSVGAGEADSSAGVPQFQQRLVRELAWGSTISLMLGGVIGVLTGIPAERAIVMPLGTALVSTPLWATGLSHAARSSALSFGVLLTGAVLVASTTHQAPAPLALMFIGTAWAALLAPRAIARAALVVCALTFVIGAEWHAGQEPLAALDMNVGIHWLRVGLVATVIFAVYALSLTRIVEAAQAGLAEARAKLTELNDIRKHKSQEVVRRRVIERAAQQTERLETTGQLAGTIAHDVNNALQAIMGWADELTVEELSDEEHEEAKRNLLASIDYAEALTGQFAADETSRAVAPPVVNVTKAARRAAAMLSVMLQDRCTLVLDLEENCCAAIHERDVRRVLFNLVANARDAMPNGGTVTVALKRTPNGTASMGSITLSVSDTGEGMSDEVRARIFQPFFTTKSEGKGTGLGLHTVSHVAKRSAAQIEVDSELGKGSTFSLRLRARSIRFVAAPPQEVAVDRTQTYGTILLAEDDSTVRQILARVLRRARFTVIEAKDGDEAGEELGRRDDIDALCIDGVMPGRPTADLITEFLARWPSRPVVLCSGHLPEDLERRHLGRDDVTFLAKPFPADKLVTLLEARLRAVREAALSDMN